MEAVTPERPTPIAPSVAVSAWWPLLFLVCLAGILLSLGIQSRSLWASHEARAAQNAQHMLDTGDWLLPRLFDSTTELQKPPGFYWLVAITGWCRGRIDELAVRLPAIFAGVGMVIGLWWWFQRQQRPIAGFIAAGVLLSAVHFTGTARIGRIDVPLGFAVMGVLLIFHQPLIAQRSGCIALAGLFTALAILLKGPIGFVLITGVCVFSLAVRSRVNMKVATAPVMGLSLILGLLIALPWFVIVHSRTDGEFTRVFFWYHHVNRAFGGAEALAAHPWWFYLARLAVDWLPWSPVLLIAIIKLPKHDGVARFGLDWLIVMLLILSASRFKRADYLIPAYPAVAILIGTWGEAWYRQRSAATQTIARRLFVGCLCFVPVGWFIFDQTITQREQASRDPAPISHEIIKLQPAEIWCYRVENHLLVYQLQRPVRTLTEWSQLQAAWQTEPNAVVIMSETEPLLAQQNQWPFRTEILVRSADVAPQMTHRPLVVLRRTP